MARAVPLVVLQLVVGCTGAVEYDSERRRARNSGGSDGGDSGGDSNRRRRSTLVPDAAAAELARRLSAQRADDLWHEHRETLRAAAAGGGDERGGGTGARRKEAELARLAARWDAELERIVEGLAAAEEAAAAEAAADAAVAEACEAEAPAAAPWDLPAPAEARRRLLTLRFSDGSACGCSRLCVEADDCCGEAYACYEEGSG